MTPAYFNPAAQPDTETQYRRGGKVNKMQKLSVAKKMPRKFGEGGVAKPTDKITPEMRAKIKAEAEANKNSADQNAAMNKFYENQNRLGPIKKAKGGSIRRFYEGGDIREGANSNISDDTRARAQRFLETGKKDDDNDVAATKATYKLSPKNISTVKTVAKPTPAKTSDKSEDKSSGGSGASQSTEPSFDGGIGSYRRDAPTLGNRGEKHEFNAENAAMLATLAPGFGAAARLGQGAYRAGRAAYEGAKGLAEGVKSGVSVAKGLNEAAKSREAVVGAREASNRLANVRAADKAKKVAEEAEKQAAKDKKAAAPIFKAAKVRADFNRIDKAAAAKKEAGFKKAAEERRASRTPEELRMQGEGGLKKGGSVRKFVKGGSVKNDVSASKDRVKPPKGYAKGGNVDSTVVKGSYTQGPKRVADDKTNAKSSYLQGKQNPDRSVITKFAAGGMTKPVKTVAAKAGYVERAKNKPTPNNFGKKATPKSDAAASKDKLYDPAGDPRSKIQGYAKGGRVSDASASKDKLKPTKGYAKGGMARGYGISKVTNRTKVC